MQYPGFIGGTYTNSSISVEGERCVNFFPEVVESGRGKNNVFLCGTPGLRLRAVLPDRPVRGIYATDDRLFVVAGATMYEVFSDWTYSALAGAIIRDDKPAQMFGNGKQIFVVAGGMGYLAQIDVAPYTVVPVVPAVTGGYLDTYFIAQQPGTANFNLSGSLDGINWDPLDFAVKESDAFRIASMLTDHQLLVLFGSRTTEFWEDAGDPDFPLQRISGGVLEQGCGAAYSPAKLGPNNFAWLGMTAHGEGMVWKAQGYQPQRISNHCVEAALQSYRKAGARLADAVGVPKQHGGHQFYELHIPGANAGRGATWVYDDTATAQLGSPQWHEKAAWDTEHGEWKGAVDRPHAYAFGQHLTGDALSGNLYEESLDYFDAAGAAIRRMRSSPHLHGDGNMVYFGALWVDAAVGGLSNLLDGAGNPRPPQMMRQISNDGGYTWGPELWVGMGMTGQYKARARWTRSVRWGNRST